jgi:hypothetical protein
MAKGPLTSTDKISISIIAFSILLIIFVLTQYTPQEEIYIIISLVGSVASTGGLIIAIIEIAALRRTTEATQKAISSTEIELSILRAIESDSNCFNQSNR